MSNHDPIFTQCMHQFNNTCTTLFLQTPYEWQTAVGSTILVAHTTKTSICQLLVRPTNVGKNLVSIATAACIKGITLCICPLLILVSDQYQIFIAKTSSDRSITCFHLDELSPHEVDNVLLPKLTALSPSQTVMIFTSPHCLLRCCYTVLETFVVMKLIRFVVVGEVHLVNNFGQSFREEFPALREPISDKLTTAPILLMTATCTHRIRYSIQTMLGLKITSTHWPCAQEMKHCSIYFDAHYSTHPMSYVTKSIKPFVTARNGLVDKVIIYANAAKSIVNFATKLGGIMDKDVVLTDIDIAAVIGRMKRGAKAET